MPRGFPLLLALALTPLLAQMKGMDIDTPDQSLAWNLPVMALYGTFFSIGWWMRANPGTLESLRDNSRKYLIFGLIASSFASAIVGIRYGGDSPALRWAGSLGTTLTMTASTFGWLGAAQSWFARPTALSRYLAEASYWMYLAHLPVVVALQIAFANTGLPWWMQIPLINIIAIAALAAVDLALIRKTWIGRWLTGKKHV